MRCALCMCDFEPLFIYDYFFSCSIVISFTFRAHFVFPISTSAIRLVTIDLSSWLLSFDAGIFHWQTGSALFSLPSRTSRVLSDFFFTFLTIEPLAAFTEPLHLSRSIADSSFAALSTFLMCAFTLSRHRLPLARSPNASLPINPQYFSIQRSPFSSPYTIRSF